MPPQSYMDKYNDPTVFNNEYNKYVQHLEDVNDEEYSSQQTAQNYYPSQSSTDDRNDDEESTTPST